MNAVTDRYYPRIFVMNLILWGLAALIFIGAVTFILWSGATYEQDLTLPALLMAGVGVVMFIWMGRSGFRQGEFSPTVVTIDDAGVRVATVPAEQSFEVGWDELEQVGLARDVANRPYAILQTIDRRERGLRSKDEIALLAWKQAPDHARAIRLTPILQQALEARANGPLPAYQPSA